MFLLLLCLLLLLLCAPYASVARHLLRCRRRWGNCFCGHAGTCMRCYAALLECKGPRPRRQHTGMRGSKAGQAGGEYG
jgi:hypothetical protein